MRDVYKYIGCDCAVYRIIFIGNFHRRKDEQLNECWMQFRRLSNRNCRSKNSNWKVKRGKWNDFILLEEEMSIRSKQQHFPCLSNDLKSPVTIAFDNYGAEKAHPYTVDWITNLFSWFPLFVESNCRFGQCHFVCWEISLLCWPTRNWILSFFLCSLRSDFGNRKLSFVHNFKHVTAESFTQTPRRRERKRLQSILNASHLTPFGLHTVCVLRPKLFAWSSENNEKR